MESINVKSEIGPLKQVLLHRPSGELENLTPDALEGLLFDDIPWLKMAQKEHDEFASTLKKLKVEVKYLKDLMKEVLLDENIKENFIRDFVYESNIKNTDYIKETIAYLNLIGNVEDLIDKTMSGISRYEILGNNHSTLSTYLDNNTHFLCDPMPNLYFMRDSFTSIINSISINKMRYETRRRETLFTKYIFTNHKDYKDITKLYDRTLPYNIEGGDILVLSKTILAIGISQRTCPEAIEELAKNIFYGTSINEIETILAFNIPKTRAYMHLDTVFTQVDYDKFTIHSLIKSPLEVFEISKSKDINFLKINYINDTLEKILCRFLKLSDVTLIPCGGGDYVVSKREQWNDGSNTLAISPGEVIVYSRNYVTNELLAKNSIKIHEISSSELSRGRGGPRCMSMPLYREDL